MSITVIIPSHNRALLLEKSLASLALQTERDFHVLVVDHGSTDHTRDVCTAFQDKLSLNYCWLEKKADAPGMSRHFGMQQVITPLVAFLDCGIVVPSFYIAAHLAFHRQHQRYVGVGLYHGGMIEDPNFSGWLEVLKDVNIDQAVSVLPDRPEMADKRGEVDLERSSVGWLYGWTGNLSLECADYWAAGGFDLELEYAFEDIDLSYRMFRQGVKFARVEDGWGIHLPHSRLPVRVRRKMHYMGTEHCYRKWRSLGLESMLYGGLQIHFVDKTFRYLSELGQKFVELPSASRPEILSQIGHPALLIGGTLNDASTYEYLALADEAFFSTERLWSCSGLRIPLDSQVLTSVVVTDMWKWLLPAFNVRQASLLECFIADIKRTAHRAYFLHTPEVEGPQDNMQAVTELKRLCQMYELPFQLLGVEQA